MQKAILLDMDGVIRHIDLMHAEKIANEIGFSFDELTSIMWDDRFLPDLIRGKISRQEWWQNIQRTHAALAKYDQDIIWNGVLGLNHLNEDLLRFVKGIKSIATTAILTNCDPISKARIVSELENYDAFHYIFSSSDYSYIKPEPELFKAVIQKLEITAVGFLFVDDSEANVKAAQGIGMNAFQYSSFEDFKTRVQRFLM